VNIWVEGILHRRLFSHSEFHVALTRTISAMASIGGSIFLGRGANMIVDPELCLRLRVVASMETRLRNVIERTAATETEAMDLIQESDKGRNDFMQRFFDVGLDDPLNYDVVLNMDRFSCESATDLVVAVMEQRGLLEHRLREAEVG
jgi:cytidylate kinase